MNVKSRQPTVSLVKFKSGTAARHLRETNAQKKHFFNRFFERVGYLLTEENYQNIKDTIVQKGRFLYPGEKGGVYSYDLNGLKLKIVFNFYTMSLITILP